MIVTEYYETRTDGTVLNRTYSDAGCMIEREGIRYEEAIDPAEFNRQYTETDEPVVGEYLTETAMKAMGYDILLGVTE